MKTIKEILISVLNELEARKDKPNQASMKDLGDNPSGMCSLIREIYEDEYLPWVDPEESGIFKSWLAIELKDQEKFFNFEREETDNKDQFIFMPYDSQSRIEWLKVKIDLLPLEPFKENKGGVR